MTRASSAVGLTVVLGALLGPAIAAAQCRPPGNSHEARLLAFYDVPTVFSMGMAPERLAAGAVRVGAEVVPVPSPNALLTHPEFCYQYTTNNTTLASVLGRPRLAIGLPGAVMLEASYLPPVTLSNARASLGSIALSRIQSLSSIDSRLALSLRAHGTLGRVTGPITCPREGLQTADPAAPCYGTQPSRDQFDPRSFGVESALGMTGGRIAGYVGGGVTWARPHFQAGFTDASGNVDRTTVDVSLVRASVFSGATLRLRDDVDVSGQVYAVPRDATTVRFAFMYHVR